jgi:hypothetical protein
VVGAAGIDGDFGKPVRVLVPEGRARRPVAESPRAFEDAVSRAPRGSMAARKPVIALP